MSENAQICRLLFVLVLILINLQLQVNSKEQYVQPMMMGMQIAIPYDIANIWNRPVSFAPYLSTFCGLALMYILFFGVITSPFGYMFGIPSQKYVMGLGADDTNSVFSILLKLAEQINSDAQTNGHPRGFGTSILRRVLKYQWDSPDFRENALHFVTEESLECQQLVLCSVHSSLRSLSKDSISAYQIFSKTLANVPSPYKTAITAGLRKGRCEEEFQDCDSDLHSIVLRTLLKLMPQWMRKSHIVTT